jgi:hypothetical protein
MMTGHFDIVCHLEHAVGGQGGQSHVKREAGGKTHEGFFMRILVDARFTDADGDIDIQLVDASGTVLATSNSISDDEYIDYTVVAGGTYYIRVYFGDAGNRYQLWWDDVQP